MDNKLKNSGFRPGNVLIGGLLILLGIVFLIGELFNIRIGQFIWPFFIIGPGVFLFLLSLMLDEESGKGLSGVGGLVTMVGLVLFFQNVTGYWATWAYAWALVAPTSIGLGMFSYGLLKGKADIRQEGWNVAKVGLAIFIVAAVFFELIVGLSGFGLGRYGWPSLLIVLGIFLLFRNLRSGWGHEEEPEPELEVSKKTT
jgi:hypothetical protein